MDFFKVKKFRKTRKPKPQITSEDNSTWQHEELINENGDMLTKTVNVDSPNVDNSNADAEDDDDDFITNEVKRRLKELRRNNFMELIPEEESSFEEEDEEGEEVEMACSQWKVVEAEGRQFWSGFDAIYDIYCQRMLFFDRVIAQQLPELDFYVPLTPSPRISSIPPSPSPRSRSKKLLSPFSCLSLNVVKVKEHLQQPISDPYQDLEAAYVSQLCLTWEAIHCQYTQMSQKISCQPENRNAYNHAAQQFQQFQVLLQRFIENEPFEQGARPEIYARSRKLMPKLLQVPKIQGSDQPSLEEEEEEDSQLFFLAPDLIKIIDCTILTFRLFLKSERQKNGVARKFFGNQNQVVSPLQQQVHSSLEKKVLKLKELRKRQKNWKEKSWPTTEAEVQLLLAVIDAKIVSRVLRMVGINNDQLLWCEQKTKKLDFSGGKLRRDPFPLMFPC